MTDSNNDEKIIEKEEVPMTNIHANHDLIVLLEKSKRTSESLIYHLPDLIMIIDKNGRILKGNFQIEEAVKSFGAELLYFPVSRLFTDESWKQFQKNLTNICNSSDAKKTVEFELLTDGINSISKLYHWKLSILEGLKSQSPLVTVVGHDITEIKEMFREIEESHDKLNKYSEDLKKLIGVIEDQNSQIMEASQLVQLGEMAGGIAQEISLPIDSLKTHADKMNRAISSDKSGSHELEENTLLQSATSIAETVDEVSRVIKTMRFLSRSGKNDPFEMVNIKQVVEDSLVYFKSKFDRNGIKLMIDFEKNDIWAQCKAVQISQIIINLLNNCNDFISHLDEKWVKVKLYEDQDNSIIISVTDSGKGIQKDVVKMMFKPFYSTKKDHSGLGVGLSTSEFITHDHGGNIWLDESSENTKIVIKLPKMQKNIHLRNADKF
ncbi:MAG: ATP-binding protein [Oligoflexales bacterium]